MSRWSDDPYYISPEEERALEEREEEERWREEVAAREEQEIEAWLASRSWLWNHYKELQWRLYWGPRRWLLTHTSIGRRYVDFKIDRDRVRRGLKIPYLSPDYERWCAFYNRFMWPIRHWWRNHPLVVRYRRWRWARELLKNDEVPF